MPIYTVFTNIGNFKILYYHCNGNRELIFLLFVLTHSHTMTPFDAPGKQAF